MGKVSNIFKRIVSAVVKVVKVIVKVVKFVVNAIINFVKGVLRGDIASIIMLVAIIFTFGAALGWFAPLIEISMSTAVVSSGFTILASEYQREKAVKMQKQAEKDLDQKAEAAQNDLNAQAAAEKARLNEHFSKMEGDRYHGYESGKFGIGSFEPEGVFTPDKPNVTSSKQSNLLSLLGFGLLLGGVVAYTTSDQE